MREHTTHHDDCGCLSETKDLRIQTLEQALKHLLEKGSALKKYHAFIPDAVLFIEFEVALETAKGALQ